jgi:uncharacterized membrane protein (GlpM family)
MPEQPQHADRPDPTRPDRVPEDDGGSIACCHGRSRGALAWSLIAACAMIASPLVLRAREWPEPARVAIALVPIVPLIGMFAAIVAASRRMDELQRRIQFEALAIAVVLSCVLSFMLGQLQRIDLVRTFDLGVAWAILAFTYAGAYAFVARRYH